MSWIICGEDKQGNPFTFEANSVKGSCRTALGALLKQRTNPIQLIFFEHAKVWYASQVCIR